MCACISEKKRLVFLHMLPCFKHFLKQLSGVMLAKDKASAVGQLTFLPCDCCRENGGVKDVRSRYVHLHQAARPSSGVGLTDSE